MRRLVRVLSLIGLGLLLGFMVRLVWPHSKSEAYPRPAAGER